MANISIGGPGTETANCGKGTDPMHYAICRSVKAGVAYAVAAGNDGHDIARTVPATYDEVLTATAIADFDGKPDGLADPICGPEDWSVRSGSWMTSRRTSPTTPANPRTRPTPSPPPESA